MKKEKVILILFVLLLVVGSVILVRNPYKSYYKKETPVTNKEAVESLVNMAGYPAGEGIIVAKSIEDIMSNEYCTIEVSKENIESTRYFLIKDKSESGSKNSKVGRRYYFNKVYEAYSTKFDLLGNMKYLSRQIGWNLDNTSYGEWHVVTLESGERILALFDTKLLDIPKEKSIKLPIGKVVSNFSMTGLQEKCDTYGVEEENCTWYINMIGNWEEREIGDIYVTMWLVIIFLVEFPLAIYLAYKYIEKKGY